LGPIICGFLGERINWHVGFGAAGVGMILGVIQYRYGGRYLGDAGQRRVSGDADAARRKGIRILGAGLAGLAALGMAVAGLQAAGTLHVTLPGAARFMGVVILGIALVYFASVLFLGRIDVAEKKRVFVLFLFFIASCLFWAGYEQQGSSFNLFASRLTDRMIGSWEIPASWFLSFPAICVILLAPVFGNLWLKLGRREPSMPAKLGTGLVFGGLGFVVMVFAAIATRGGAAKVAPWWLLTTYFIHTVGELCLSPVGLSSVTKLAPRRMVGQLMGTFFMGNALGNLIAGLAAGSFSTMPLPKLFGTVAWVLGGAGLLLILFSRPIRGLNGPLSQAQTAAPAAVPARSVAVTD